jgi:hypothetical protein
MKKSIRAPAIAMLAMAMVLAGPARAQTATGPEQPISAEAAPASQAASDTDLEGARGGWVWVVIGLGASASIFVVRQCASRADSCARGALAVFTTAKLARRWVCRRTGRLC